ncbi:hypothetical protein LOK49_LG06G01009 [Camellia lanceoleosa]|uniref:Uncharacterized protein n=1 Tax=Camellia lanceoleosa TaxID=1840588 RepID=A0ACC0HBZ9_9ERIC|nr:hypothetical protein LOK49_LG06G01009 [Camellia lanceoleosa]
MNFLANLRIVNPMFVQHVQTPEGSLLVIIRNVYDLLSHCDIKIPKIEGNEKYVDSGPPYLIFLHPALGPLWEVTRQKVTNTPWGERVSFLFDPTTDLVAKSQHISPFMVVANGVMVDWLSWDVVLVANQKFASHVLLVVKLLLICWLLNLGLCTMVPGIKTGRRKRATSANVLSTSEACPLEIGTPLTFSDETEPPDDTQTVVEETQPGSVVHAHPIISTFHPCVLILTSIRSATICTEQFGGGREIILKAEQNRSTEQQMNNSVAAEHQMNGSVAEQQNNR